jgi:hypothetical protein
VTGTNVHSTPDIEHQPTSNRRTVEFP